MVFFDAVYGTNNNFPRGWNDGTGTDQNLVFVAGYTKAMRWEYADNEPALTIDTSGGDNTEIFSWYGLSHIFRKAGTGVQMLRIGGVTDEIIYGVTTHTTRHTVHIDDSDATAFLIRTANGTVMSVKTDGVEAISWGNATDDFEWNDQTGSPGAATNVWTSNGAGTAPTWQAAAGAGSLDAAYNVGATITADSGAVTINGTAVGGDDLLVVNHTISGSLTANTTNILVLTSSRTDTGSGTFTDNFDAASFTRTNESTAGSTFTAQGSVLRLENVSTQTGGTLTDSVICLEIVQDTGSTGAILDLKDGSVAVVSISQATPKTPSEHPENARQIPSRIAWP